MSGSFAGKVVLITGGAGGIGLGCAQVFSKAGAKTIIIVDKDDLNRESMGGRAQIYFLRCDVRDIAGLEMGLQECIPDRLDCLINNVGVHPAPTPLHEFNVASFEDLIRINVTSAALVTNICRPSLRRTQGTIINISSIVALYGEDLSGEYAATKAALIGFTRAWAIELARFGIRVNCVAPSSVQTPSMDAWIKSCADPEAAARQESQMHLIRRIATPKEIGEVCLFLTSDASSFMTGQVIQVEGGATLWHPRCGS